jgi:hypothetical protein
MKKMIFKKKQVAIFIIFLFIILNISSIQAETFTPLSYKNESVEILEKQTNINQEILDSMKISCNDFSTSSQNLTALVLNPSEHIYGNKHCLKIINNLLTSGYNIEYLSNDAVDLPYIKTNLSAEIIYINTHAGYWDLDGDNISDIVVISTGEYWTNETPINYQFEYENQMIVEGIVGNESFVAFTPALINYYYNPGDFPNSLIYMATCYASYDDSMAEVFLDKGASAYMGWSKNTAFWTNSITSVLAMRFLTNGFTVKQVCNLIRSGGFINFLLQSKLIYYGYGNHRI